MTYRSGDVADHDREVEEARWVDIEQAMRLLAFKAEQGVVAKAKAMIGRENDEGRRTEDE
jgi:NADH pyrophosphatase NudC (nudix superfamily)